MNGHRKTPPGDGSQDATHRPALTALQSARAWIGSALFVLIEIVTVIPWSFIVLLSAVLPFPMRYHITTLWPRAMLYALRWLCGVRWQRIGSTNLPDRPVILLSKHQSTWETFYLVWAMPRMLAFVYKRELLFVPFFGWGLGLLDMIHIDRSKGRAAFDQVVSQSDRKLAEGRWIIFFPEGTRTAPGSQGQYKSGGARLAMRTGVPVVPIAVNAGRLWPRHGFPIRPGLVTVSIGPLIESTGKTAERLTSEVETWIEAEMRRISPDDYATVAGS